MKRFIVILFVLSFSMFIQAQEKEITFEVMGIEQTTNYSDDKVVKINYRVTNNAFGTLYAFSFDVLVFDDRDNKMDVVFDYVDVLEYRLMFSTPSYYPSVKAGESIDGYFTAEGDVRYIKRIVITRIDNHNFNMRNLPEDIDPIKLVKFKSLIDGLIIQTK